MKKQYYLFLALLFVLSSAITSCKKKEDNSKDAVIAMQQRMLDSIAMRNAIMAEMADQKQGITKEELTIVEDMKPTTTPAPKANTAPKQTKPKVTSTPAPAKVEPVATSPTVAEVTTQPRTNPQTVIDKQLGIWVVASKGQNADQQNADEADSYNWAKQQTGYDPMNPPKVEVKQESAANGQVIRGGAKGAAVGAAVGAIAGDAGKGAAIGATAGGAVGVNKRLNDHAKSNQNAQAEANQIQAEMFNNFKRAFIAAMKGKGYSIN